MKKHKNEGSLQSNTIELDILIQMVREETKSHNVLTFHTAVKAAVYHVELQNNEGWKRPPGSSGPSPYHQ